MRKLNDPTLLETRAYVNGHWLETGKTFPVYNPSTEVLVANVTDMDAKAAYQAKTDWAAHTGKERSAILMHWFNLMVKM